jgi:hypothetical protein
MLLRITAVLFGIILSFIIASSSANVYAEQNVQKENIEQLLQGLVGNYNLNQDSLSLTTNKENIAFVLPSFTMAAYTNSFYVFYAKYESVVKNYEQTGKKENVTSDLNLLTSTVPQKNLSLIPPKSIGLQYLAQHTSQLSPNTNINFLTDEDVHNGLIFNSNKQNLYNAIVLGHQEYVTQQEYGNLKKFVENGGILILLDANMFYAEVSYDPTYNQITLVKGHYWAFDGQKAWPDVKERWATDNTEWVGSNFYCSSCTVLFGNNPFQYAHYEENYITNPNAKVLIDYQAKSDLNYPIGAYELKTNLGKVISFGIYGDNIVANQNFLDFFDKILIENDIISKSTQSPPQQNQQQPISQADTLSKIPFSSGTTISPRGNN